MRFIEAFNARDAEALRAIVTADVEFRNPEGGALLRGHDGVRALIEAARRTNLRLVREGDASVEKNGRTALPVTVIVGEDHVHGTALFEVRDGRVAAFEVISELVES